MSPRSAPGFLWMVVASITAATFAAAAPDPLGLRKEEATAVNRILLGDKAPPEPGTLRWRNGETIKGELIDATAEEVRWKSPLFEDPLVLAWPALRRFDQALAAVAVADPFAVSLRNGSHLYGDLVAVTDQTVSIRSTRHGTALLKRSEVLSVRRLRGGNLIAAGPTGDAEWRPLTGPKRSDIPVLTSTSPGAIPLLKTGPGGALLLPYWNRGASLELKFPERLDLEFRVRSSTRPDFQLSLDAGSEQRLRVETWDNELVLTAADQFKSLRKIAETEREVALRICWDRKARKCSVFTPAGEWITDWEVPDDSRGGNGQLVLQGKGRDLALDSLRVRTWDGQPPAKLAGNLSRVEFADGRIVEGQIGAGETGSITLRASGADSASPYPLSDVDALVFSTDAPKTAERQTTLTFADGTLLCGRISSIRDDQTTLITSFAEEPFATKTRDLQQMLIDLPAPDGAPPETPLEEFDTVALQGGITLHGKLATGDTLPRWLPVGGKSPARMANAASAVITRAAPAGAKTENAAALFFTTSGDVLPGRLRGLDASGVEIEDGLFSATRLPAGNLEAIVFGGATNTGMKGFGDSGWRVLKGNETSVKKTAESVQMQPETAIGHSSIMQSSEIQFSLTTEGFGGARLRLFSTGEERTDASNLVLANLGGRLYYGMEAVEGQMGGDLQQTTLSTGGVMVVRLVIDDKRVELSVNGVSLRTFAIPPAKRKGSGLVIKPGNVFGNEERSITVSELTVKATPGRIWIPDVTAETRLEALTVPRFRKENPPRQVLLAANGDVLRGEIEAATASHFGFRSGLENLRVPRERVKAAIWLKKPGAEAPKPVATNPALKTLDQRITRQIRYGGAGLSTLIGVLQREVPDLKFKLPTPEDSRRVSKQFGGQTIGEDLDEICGLFDLRYRVEDDGTIVLEKGTQAPKDSKDLLEKVYWLKPAALPGEGSTKDILASKGVPFPAKASALWQPNAGQLTMTNTAANHEKLAAALAAEFGGSLGSPTHWLLLTSGARFGLAVEKFESDAISGRHPIYGQCRVPMTQVHMIRTSPPEPNAAIKSLQDWRLVFAPEPVLPETGGESSPTLGKAAKPFKLPLLGGGNFELANEQGKIVVLDFWATWCGPCIKSLPGLIEAMSAFPLDRVKLIGVNQSEPAELVKRFLETRNWKLAVAMDAGQGVARQYGVEGIPHTVIVGPDGKVAWVKTGYSPDGATEVANAVKQILAALSAPK